jgi:tRNA-dihydrouridine synthase
MRKFVIQYFRGFLRAREFRQRWMTAESFKEIEELLSELNKLEYNFLK